MEAQQTPRGRILEICGRKGLQWLKPVLAVVLMALAVGCPLPYQYSLQGWAGNASAVDPSSPGITASPTLEYAASAGGSGTLTDTGTATTSSDTTITLQTATPGSVIYYTTDGTTPDPRGAHTSRYTPGVPLTLSIAAPTVDDSSRTLTVKASAIGPNMKPSLVTSATVNLQYPQAAAPSFSIPGQAYTSDQTLDLTTTTAGAAIYYTMVSGPGPAPRPVPGQAGTVLYTGSISVNGPSNTWTIAAIAVKGQMIDSTTATASYSVAYQGLPDPTFNPPPGTFTDNITVRIDSGVGATIWYTTDGTTPVVGTSPNIPAGGSLIFNNGGVTGGVTTIHAIAAQAQMASSATISAGYVFQAAAPIPSVTGGTFNNNLANLSLSTATSGATVHYTTDGSLPSALSAVYAAPFAVNSTTTVQSIAVRTNYQDSPVRTDIYSMQVAPPNFSLAGGTYPSAVSITLTGLTSGAAIHYTTDGSTPTTSSTLYTGSPIAISSNGTTTTVKAIGVKTGYAASPVAAATYVIMIPVSGLLVGTATSSTIAVSWGAVAGVTSYTVLRDTSPSFTAPYYLYPSSTSFTDSALPAGVTYYYAVIAVYSIGSSARSAAAIGATLDASGMPLVQTVSTAGLPASSLLPAGAPGGDYWIGTVQPGWVAGGYRYVIWDPDYQNWGSFAIGAYDSAGTLVAQWLVAANRYITSVSKDGSGNIVIVGQNGTSLVPWVSIKL